MRRILKVKQCVDCGERYSEVNGIGLHREFAVILDEYRLLTYRERCIMEHVLYRECQSAKDLIPVLWPNPAQEPEQPERTITAVMYDLRRKLGLRDFTWKKREFVWTLDNRIITAHWSRACREPERKNALLHVPKVGSDTSAAVESLWYKGYEIDEIAKALGIRKDEVHTILRRRKCLAKTILQK